MPRVSTARADLLPARLVLLACFSAVVRARFGWLCTELSEHVSSVVYSVLSTQVGAALFVASFCQLYIRPHPWWLYIGLPSRCCCLFCSRARRICAHFFVFVFLFDLSSTFPPGWVILLSLRTTFFSLLRQVFGRHHECWLGTRSDVVMSGLWLVVPAAGQLSSLSL